MKKVNYNKQTGFTIIELLVAALLAMILLGSTTVMFVTNKENSKLQNELGRLQENARFAIDLLTKDIRMVDYIGCHQESTNLTNQINFGTQTLLDFSETLDGADGSATTVQWDATDSTSSAITSMSVATDAITVRYILPIGQIIRSDISSTGNPTILTGEDLPQGEFLAISNCSTTDLFQNTSSNTETSGTIEHSNAGGTPGNTNSAFSLDYDAGAEINKVVARRYFIAASSSGTGTSLWWENDDALANADVTDNTQELVEGVQNMQILYGEDTNSDEVIEGFFTSDNVTNWDNVKAVKVGLLMETVNEIGVDVDSNTYNLLGTNIAAANDRRKRKIFTTTISIRNRM